jgi:PPIC-type PPIASE domain
MNRDLWIGCLLLGTMAWAQAQPATSATAPNSPAAAKQRDRDDDTAKPPAATGVAADTPVLTIKGLCGEATPTAGAKPAKSSCQTVITRAQFENLIDALHAGKDSQSVRDLARAYPQFLVMAHEAEQRGLDKQPRFQERLNFARLQILSQMLMTQIQEEAAKVPESDIEDYYRKNSSDFETASLERIVIPNRTRAKTQPNQKAEPGEDLMTKEAELLRARAAAGEDFSKLQKEAYDAAGVSGNSSPDPRMENLRRRGLPPAHASVFDLQPGQVSPVISDATGHYIYKLDSKGMDSLEVARPEISKTLRAQRVKKMIESIQQPFATEVNRAYFGADASGDSD